MIKNGFKPGRIKVFKDGFGGWEKASYPVEKGESEESGKENIFLLLTYPLGVWYIQLKKQKKEVK